VKKYVTNLFVTYLILLFHARSSLVSTIQGPNIKHIKENSRMLSILEK
jgi:hypothetical protein